MTHLQQVFDVLKQNSLFVKFNKCDFGDTKVEYLGHVIGAGVMSMDASNITSVLNWPVLTLVNELRGVLGLIKYYRRFICRYGFIAKPLTQLLKERAF